MVAKGRERVKFRRTAAAVCALTLIAVLGPGEETRPADADLELELEVGRTPLVALTFDDGPRKSTTGPLLDGLALREVPATFFLVGDRVPGNEELICRMAAEGHQIGVHTYGHVILSGLSREEFDAQVGRSRELLERVLGEGEFWLRPPYGIVDGQTALWAQSPLILWSVDPEDWRDQDVERIVSQVLAHAGDGDIILMHDIYPSSVEAALEVVDALLERGFCFVTVEQLMAERQIQPEPGRVYRTLPGAES